MAWEIRGQGRYFYESRRRRGVVEKIYLGKGALGELAAGLINESRRKRAEQAESLASEQARLATLVRAMARLDEAVRLMLQASLIASDYQRHDHHWRRRRVRLEDRGVAQAAGRG
jgi:hypothetical protein